MRPWRALAGALPVLLSCAGPAERLWAREAAWADLDLLERREDLRLTRLPTGDPVGYWPRLVLKREGWAMDNRAWLLSQGLREDEVVDLLVERQRPDFDEGALKAALGELETALARGREEYGLFGPAALLLVPDERLPGEVLDRVWRLAAAASPRPVTAVGRVDGHLRTPFTRAPEGYGRCARGLVLDQQAAGLRVLGFGPAPLGPRAGECAAFSPEEIGPALRALAERCAAVEPGFCLDLVHQVSDGATAGEVLRAQASVWAVGEPLRQGPMAWLGQPTRRDCAAVQSVASLDEAALARACAPPLRVFAEEAARGAPASAIEAALAVPQGAAP